MQNEHTQSRHLQLAFVAPLALAALLAGCGPQDPSGASPDQAPTDQEQNVGETPGVPNEPGDPIGTAPGEGETDDGSTPDDGSTGGDVGGNDGDSTGGNTGGATPDRLLATMDGLSQTGFGGVTSGAIETEFGGRPHYMAGGNELSVGVDSDGNKFLRQRYIPTGSGSKVVEFPVTIPGANEMWLSYRIYFEPGWQFVMGGKLPGLAGGSMPTGGSYDDNGFSARLMWRANGAISVYAYHHDRPEKWGQDFYLTNSDGSRWSAPIGKWFTVRERVKMNSSGSAKDGEVEVWIDGERKLLKTGLRWRMNTNYSVDRFLYSSFYGGGSSEWAPSTTTHARFDDFKVSSSAAGVD